MIAELDNLTYLEDRPVDQREKWISKAFILNGREGEEKEKEKIKQEK